MTIDSNKFGLKGPGVCGPGLKIALPVILFSIKKYSFFFPDKKIKVPHLT
jgi:hypothetical protein